MRWLTHGVLALIISLGFSFFSVRFSPYIQIDPAVNIGITNVTDPDSYIEPYAYSCFGNNQMPCQLDLGLINPSHDVTGKYSLILYLQSNFSTASDRVAEINRITINRKMYIP